MSCDSEEFVAVKSRAFITVMMALAMGAFIPSAALAESCASADEVDAFRLRHLQSRLMVAGLSCGQREAYNAFMTRHKPDFGGFGPRLIAYYQRAGGGLSALNRYVTDLANAAASIRSDDPVAFCTHTWAVFWALEQDPTQLKDMAAANPVPAISQPALCTIPLNRPKPTPTRAPQKRAAAQ
jgi:hypothetical protein